MTNARFFRKGTTTTILKDLTVPDLDVAARIETATRGGPVRLIINGRHFKPVGRYASRKARRALPWEAEGELLAIWLSEADARVRDYLSQPHKLTLRRPDGGELVYYPDIRRDLVDGTVEIIEVKKRGGDGRRGPDYPAKLRLARLVYQGLGWVYRIVAEEDLRDSREVMTAWAIQRRRATRITRKELFALAAAIDGAGGAIRLDDASGIMGGGPAGRAKVYAAIIRGFARTDLSEAIHRGTPVMRADRGAPAPAAPRGV